MVSESYNYLSLPILTTPEQYPLTTRLRLVLMNDPSVSEGPTVNGHFWPEARIRCSAQLDPLQAIRGHL